VVPSILAVGPRGEARQAPPTSASGQATYLDNSEPLLIACGRSKSLNIVI